MSLVSVLLTESPSMANISPTWTLISTPLLEALKTLIISHQRSIRKQGLRKLLLKQEYAQITWNLIKMKVLVIRLRWNPGICISNKCSDMSVLLPPQTGCGQPSLGLQFPVSESTGPIKVILDNFLNITLANFFVFCMRTNTNESLMSYYVFVLFVLFLRGLNECQKCFSVAWWEILCNDSRL